MMTKTDIQTVLDALVLANGFVLEYGDLDNAIDLCVAKLAEPSEAVNTDWNRKIRDSVDSLLAQANYAEDSSARHQLAMMNFDTHPAPSKPEPDKDLIQALTERDEYHDMADKLAEGIALHFDGDIGEHSSSNSPWDRALDLLDSAACAETMRLSKPSKPVAEVAGDYNTKHIIFLPAGIALEVGDKLFDHPASKPAPLPELTDAEIEKLYLQAHDSTLNQQGWGIRSNVFARAIEQAVWEKAK